MAVGVVSVVLLGASMGALFMIETVEFRYAVAGFLAVFGCLGIAFTVEETRTGWTAPKRYRQRR